MDIRVDLGSSIPIYIQIADRIRHLVASGALAPCAQLPTIRQLAVDLAVDPNTVARAYALLDTEGVISTQRGRGTYVSGRPDLEHLAQIHDQRLHAMLRKCIVEALSLGYTPAEVLMAFSQELNDRPRAQSDAPPRQ